MTKPFKLSIAEYYPQNAYSIYSGLDDALDKILDFMDMRPLNTQEEYNLKFKIKITVEKARKLDVLFTNAMMSVLLSPKVMGVLQEICPEQFQIFDTVIMCKDGDVTEYKAINILNYYDVSDPDKSVYRYFDDGDVRGYDKFVIKDQPMEPLHVARDKKFPPKIIISATLKEALEKAKIRGCRYWSGDEPED